jgi:hypothetical protein
MQLDLFKEPTIRNNSDSIVACKCCGEELEHNTDNFYVKNRILTKKGGEVVYLHYVCKSCTNDNSKITSLLRKQNAHKRTSSCDCCGKIVTETKGINSLVIDHDHETGEFRGWVCNDCNVGIGRLGDTVEGLEQAIDYLKGNK